MLKKVNRLRKNKDFAKVSRQGKFYSYGMLSVKVKMQETKNNQTRIGIAVGINFSKKAVERNRVKRQLREIARQNLKNIKTGFDIVLMIKSREKNISIRDLKKDFLNVLKISGILID